MDDFMDKLPPRGTNYNCRCSLLPLAGTGSAGTGTGSNLPGSGSVDKQAFFPLSLPLIQVPIEVDLSSPTIRIDRGQLHEAVEELWVGVKTSIIFGPNPSSCRPDVIIECAITEK